MADMDDILEKVTAFADRSHGEQLRKYSPDRYIVHPIRVMQTCRRFTDDITMLAAALLHDVLEDTPVSKPEMKDFLREILDEQKAERTLNLVIELTDVYVKKDFPKLNRRTRKAKELERLEKTSGDSQTIKYADIIDNTNEIVRHDRDFARVYLFECRAVLARLNKGHAELHKIATDTVNENIGYLQQR